MAWIESHQEMDRHPKTRKLARLLGEPVLMTIGRLHVFWHWALDFAQDGDLSRYDATEIAEAAMWDGNADQFVEAMVQARWIDRTDDYTHSIHDWNDYAGHLLHAREVNKAKQQRWRDRQKAAKQEPLSEDQERNGYDTVTYPVRNMATVPNRTLPNHTVPITVTNRGDAGRANQQRAPEKKEFPREQILAKVPAATKAKYTPEEITRQFERAVSWLEEHPTAHMSSKFFADWLQREIDQGRWLPVNLSEIERLKRLRETKPDEKGLYYDDQQSYTSVRLRQKIEELETMEIVLAREQRTRELRAAEETALHNGHQTRMVSDLPSHHETPS